MTKRQITIGLSIIIALVQLFDIFIHIATNQAEPLRILSNLIILTWLGSLVSDRFLKRLRPFGFGVIALYLMLNSVFLMQEGIVNSANGELRTALFIFAALTLGLSVVMAAIHRRA